MSCRTMPSRLQCASRAAPAAVIIFALATSAIARPAQKIQSLQPLSTQTFDPARRLDAGEFNMWQDNSGSFAFEQQLGGPGLLYPRGSNNSLVFAAGLWVGARVLGSPRVTVAEYSTEFAPGRVSAGVPEPPTDPNLIVYKMTRFTGDPADTGHVERTPAELAADPTLDPIAHHSWTEYMNGAAPRGAPVRFYKLPNTSTPTPDDSLIVPGPDVKGDQMTWCVFNDADPGRHANNSGSTQPLGIEVRRTFHTLSVPGILGSTVFMDYEIINRGSQTLQDMMISLWSDPDIGLFTDDLVGTDQPLGLVYAYNGSAGDPAFGTRPPAVGFTLIEGPVLPNGDTLRTYSTNRYVNGTDPSNAAQSYNYMLGLNADGSTLINPVSGLPTRFVFTGDPVVGAGWVDTSGSDKRMMISTGPVTLAPGATTRVSAALVMARGRDRLTSVTLLKRYTDFARDAYYHVGRFASSDLAIIHHAFPGQIHGCEPTFGEFRLVNFGPDTGPFQLSWTLSPASGLGGTQIINESYPGLPSGAALDTSAAVTLSGSQFATDLKLMLSADRRGDLYDIDRSNNESILATSHAVPSVQSLAQVSSAPGSQARVRFTRSARDSSLTLSPITQYEVYRRVDGPGPLTSHAESGSRDEASTPAKAAATVVQLAVEAGMQSDPAILGVGWDFVGAVPAHGTSLYSIVVPLLPEVPSPSGYQAFLVRAATATPTLFFDSCVDSMPQVDSLPPSVPANLRVTSVNPAGDVQLAWDAVGDPDLRRYSVHRGANPTFVPSASNLVATPTAASCKDLGGAAGGGVAYYKVAAEDYVGNRSGYALSGSGTVDVPGDLSVARFELGRPAPNPFADKLRIPFALPAASRVSLSIFDVSGRLVRQPLRATMVEAGRHEWRWDGVDARGRGVAPGLYLVRLEAGSHTAVRRVMRME